MQTSIRPALAGFALALGALASCPVAAATPVVNIAGNDPVVLSFATVGDSRQDPTTQDISQRPLSAQDAHWLQNSKAWSRIMREVVQKKSKLLFFNGDMIMGYGNADLPATWPATVDGLMATDVARTYAQYAFWRGMVATTLEAGTYVVPVPGNHEVQCSTKVNASCSSANGGKNALAVNENAWRANMGDLIIDSPRFSAIVGQAAANFTVNNNPCPAGGPCVDGLSTDQSQLSYSFDVGGSHFAVINTDGVGRDSHAPTAWLTQDFANARGRGAKNFFVFGHKPAYSYYYAGSDTTKANGLDADLTARNAFWDLIETYGATYFSGHEHIFNVQQPRNAAWQVLVGSGGSPFDASNPNQPGLLPTDRMYAWAQVSVHQSGRVRIEAFGFPDNYGPTQKLWSVQLAH